MAKSKTAIRAGGVLALGLALLLTGLLPIGVSKVDASPGGLSASEGHPISYTLPEGVGAGSAAMRAGASLVGTTLMVDTFESGIGYWAREGSPTWGTTTYRRAGGSYSAYCAQSGVAAPGPYPNNVDSFMWAGPFDLSAAGSALLWFDIYLDTEQDHDYCIVMASTDGVNFTGGGWSGSSGGWRSAYLDLSAVPAGSGHTDMTGDSSVWIAFWFYSDGSTRGEGAYIDNVQLDVDPPPTGPPSITSLVPDYGSTAGDKVVIINGTNFTGATSVTFGGEDALDFLVVGLSAVLAVAPPHGTVEKVDVQVITPLGTSADTDADDFYYVPPVNYSSIIGIHRYHTAQLISQAMFPSPLPGGSGLVLAPGETFQEALCGAPLAAAWGGPVLLTPSIGLENGTKAEMQRLDPSYVFCIGLSSTVVTQVGIAVPGATVVSIHATDVYQMSRLVASALQARVGEMSSAVAIVTVGYNFPDAIGVSPMACARLWPVILTDRPDGSPLHSSAQGALSDLGITQAIKVGTYADLGAVTGLANLSGMDRYYTCANVADWAEADAGLSFTHSAMATGDKFPDALASGPYLAKDDGILLLSPLYGPLPTPIGEVILSNGGFVEQFTFIACVEPVIGQVKALLP